jgi:secreted protein with Ig-like and vWFA domain
VETATVPRNLLILLDTSGSMLGQRYEIARQTIESVLGTLSDSDFFNIIQAIFRGNIYRTSFTNKFPVLQDHNFAGTMRRKGTCAGNIAE